MASPLKWFFPIIAMTLVASCTRVTIEQRCCTTEYEIPTQNFRVSKDFSLYIPQAFTPNGDGLNEQFYPIGTGWSLQNMIIKKGTKTYYEGEDHIDIYWDGDDADDGRYRYEMVFVSDLGDEFEVNGHVCVMRYGSAGEEIAEIELEKICDCVTMDMIDSLEGVTRDSKECPTNNQI